MARRKRAGEKKAGRAAALFVTFTTYNPNVNIFAYNRILMSSPLRARCTHPSSSAHSLCQGKISPWKCWLTGANFDCVWHQCFLVAHCSA